MIYLNSAQLLAVEEGSLKRNTETGILRNFVKTLGAGPSPKQRQRNS